MSDTLPKLLKCQCGTTFKPLHVTDLSCALCTAHDRLRDAASSDPDVDGPRATPPPYEVVVLRNTCKMLGDLVVTERTRADRAEAAAAKLQKFKDFVHSWLDTVGVPADPDPLHNAAHGCRIRGRLQWLLGRRKAPDE